MQSEIIKCQNCKMEIEFLYINDEVAAQTKCKCRTNDKDKLKKALHIIKKDILSGKHGAATKASFIKYWR